MGFSLSKEIHPERSRRNMALPPMDYPHFQAMGLIPAHYHAPMHNDMPPPPHARPQRRCELKINFYTCGRDFDFRPYTDFAPCILNISCVSMQPPPQALCVRFSGRDRELSDWLFARREYRVKYGHALEKIADAVERWRPRRHGQRFCAIVKCMHGMHRSVAMADKLAREVSRWDGVKVSVEYVLLSQFRHCGNRSAWLD